MKKYIVLLASALALTNCTSKGKEEVTLTAAEYYNQGTNLLENGKYDKAAKQFSKIYFRHPGSEIAPEAELMEAYSLYLSREYEEAEDVLDVFIQLHPEHSSVSYAYYLKALTYYMQISPTYLDQERTFQAKAALEEVITNFPHTKYAIDAELKLDLVNDTLAGADMNIGRFYLAQNNPIAAIDRFKSVVNNYSTTLHVQEALHRLVESYNIIGLKDEAIKYGAVLGHNYPDSSWFRKSFDLLK